VVSSARLILSDYGTHGWGVSSPDLPALISGAATHEDLSDDFLFQVACEAGLSSSGGIDIYQQLVKVIDGEVFSVRAKQDHYFADRADLVFSTASHLETSEDLRRYAIRDALGDATFVVCLPSDSLLNAAGSLQLGETVTLAVERGDQVEYLSLAFGGDNPMGGGTSLADLGFDMNSTVEEIFARLDDDSDLSQIDSVRTLVTA
jgi:hypothetical protein